MAPALKNAISAALLITGSLPMVLAEYKVDSRENILKTASLIADDLLGYYKGNEPGNIPGLLPPPPDGYYWWESGAMWATLIDYWHWTGDSRFNPLVTEGLLWQTGNENSFLPLNQTASMGNDDQCTWGLAAMHAVENGFPNPPAEQAQWLELAKNVFASQVERVDNGTCDGGLRWQIFPTNVGYDYKATSANVCFFNLGARLARYTGNAEHAVAAEKIWDWMNRIGLVDQGKWEVYDGAHVALNCTDIIKTQFSINAALLSEGAAFMYNQTGSDKWRGNVEGITRSTLKTFFPESSGKAASEIACEMSEKITCTTDMRFFKGVTHRALSLVSQLAPSLSTEVLSVLRSSAEAAVKQCTHGSTGRECGFVWSSSLAQDASVLTGAGEQMSALAAVSGLLVAEAKGPLKIGQSNGQTQPSGKPSQTTGKPAASETKPSAGARSGVNVLTALLVAGALIAWN